MSAAQLFSEDKYDCRNAYVAALEELAEGDNRIVAVVNDSVGSSKLGGFRTRFPERLINVGIAEQNMVGVGAGLANGGKIPFVSAASCFLTGRALEQIKADCAYSDANVKLCGMSSGIAYGELGATHHSIEDIAWLRAIDNMKIIVPSDPWETGEAIKAAAAYEGPVFVRVSRHPVPELTRDNKDFAIGKAEVLREGSDATLIANGILVHEALKAADALDQQGVNVRVVNMSTVSDLDVDVVVKAAATGAIVTAEEANARGGLGGAIAEFCAAHMPTRMRMMGFHGFVPTGSVNWLLDHYKLTAQGMMDAVLDLLGSR